MGLKISTKKFTGNSSASAGIQNTRSYEAEYNQRNNDIKSSTIQGRLVQGNKKVRGLIQKYMHENKYKAAAAAEAAKKAGGDDLQILSQRSTSTRKYMVYTPSKTMKDSTPEEFIYNNNKEYFVSHFMVHLLFKVRVFFVGNSTA